MMNTQKYLEMLGGRGLASAERQMRVGTCLDFSMGHYDPSYFTDTPQHRAVVEFRGERYVVERTGEADLMVLGIHRGGLRSTGFEYAVPEGTNLETINDAISTELNYERFEEIRFVDATGGFLGALKNARERTVLEDMKRANANN